MALPWALLAQSQYLHPPIIQIASLTGVYGISFLIVLVNSAITVILLAEEVDVGGGFLGISQLENVKYRN